MRRLFLWAVFMRRVHRGFVYILSNEAMPNIYKIGCTYRNLDERINQLSRSTSIPKKFNLIAYGIFDDCVDVEKTFHQSFKKYHYGKEYFRFTKHFLIYKVVQKFISKRLKNLGAYTTEHYAPILLEVKNGKN